eukprot:TRINITY_DN861_c0_g1_i1.p1 TRINITY_DN861_c0_g1~~TRINITY_DN861_c0_g1_i1.p1  ORF type:complete len:233 (-),score=39.42 TRINITY_DN861_c0_g1_i1:313-1011(-)
MACINGFLVTFLIIGLAAIGIAIGTKGWMHDDNFGSQELNVGLWKACVTPQGGSETCYSIDYKCFDGNTELIDNNCDLFNAVRWTACASAFTGLLSLIFVIMLVVKKTSCWRVTSFVGLLITALLAGAACLMFHFVIDYEWSKKTFYYSWGLEIAGGVVCLVCSFLSFLVQDDTQCPVVPISLPPNNEPRQEQKQQEQKQQEQEALPTLPIIPNVNQPVPESNTVITVKSSN